MALCKNADLNMTIDYSPRNESFIKNYNADTPKVTENFSIDTECEFSCAYGFYLVGSSKRHCLPVAKWDGLNSSCKRKISFELFLREKFKIFTDFRNSLPAVAQNPLWLLQFRRLHRSKISLWHKLYNSL